MNSYFLVGQAQALCPSSRQIPQCLGLLGRGMLGSSVGVLRVVVKLVLAVIDPVLEVLELVVTVVAVFDLMVVEDWHTGPRAGYIP